ncbi:DUF6777 domain-containing protein [Streptomyces sp. NPDC047085]|uniref:DUF6777 domain-containing protein n=1 Tax=Streptomyces sp. NPDC047085 TaxID=3155140 RepID=UPI00340DCAAA
MVAAAVVAVLLTRPDHGGTAKGGEVFLQSANATGPDPFTESTAEDASAPTATGSPATKAPGRTVPGATSRTATSEATSTLPSNVVRSVQGGAPGLYSGVQNRPSCDVEKQIKALQADQVKNRAYAAEAGVEPSAVPAYLRSLTPVSLRADTRVTNHGYRSGGATSYQAVLQAGTAVLIDGHGVPRARCACGNPLTPPVAQQGTPRPVGDHWAAYQPSSVVVVTPAPVIIKVFVIYDHHRHDWFVRERGDDTGRHDRHTKAPKHTHPWNRPPVLCASSPGASGKPGSTTNPCLPPSSSPGKPPSKSSSSSPGSSPSGPTSPGSSPKSPSSESPSKSPGSKSPGSESPGSTSPGSESPGSKSPGSESPSPKSPGSESPSPKSPPAESPSPRSPESPPPASEAPSPPPSGGSPARPPSAQLSPETPGSVAPGESGAVSPKA